MQYTIFKNNYMNINLNMCEHITMCRIKTPQTQQNKILSPQVLKKRSDW